jgi:hypothetical protein
MRDGARNDGNDSNDDDDDDTYLFVGLGLGGLAANALVMGGVFKLYTRWASVKVAPVPLFHKVPIPTGRLTSGGGGLTSGGGGLTSGGGGLTSGGGGLTSGGEAAQMGAASQLVEIVDMDVVDSGGSSNQI